MIFGGRELKLTVKEYDLLCLLAANKGRVFTYAQIYDKVWGDLPSGNEKDTVGYHSRNLCRKLVSSHINIESVREVGYRLRQKTISRLQKCRRLVILSSIIDNWKCDGNGKSTLFPVIERHCTLMGGNDLANNQQP